VLGAAHEAELRSKHPEAIEAFKTDAADAVIRFPEVFVELMLAHHQRDEIVFDFILRNDGELTIRGPAIELREVRSEKLLDGWTVQGGRARPRLEMPGEVIFPGDQRIIECSECKLLCKREVPLAEGDYVVGWRVYLDNSQPSAGEIDVGGEIQSARG